MRDDLHRDVLKALEGFAFKDERDYLREGRCPKCSKKSLWVRKDKPWVVRCNRTDKCGYEEHVKALFPELFENWSERYKPTQEAPNASADAFLYHARGLTITGLRGAYAQEHYHSRELNEGTATVRFPIVEWGAAEPKQVSWWERLIDRPSRFGDRKARFQPGASYAGQWWAHPEDTVGVLAESKEIWIVEGIFDALSLREHGVTAVAALTCGNYPEHALARLAQAVADHQQLHGQADRPRLVFAFDSDRAGAKYIKQYVAQAKAEKWEAVAAQIDQPAKGKVDWNDLHLRHKNAPSDQTARLPLSQEALEEYLWRGQLLLAKTAIDKAVLMFLRTKRATRPLIFDNQVFWAGVDLAKLEEARERAEKQGHDLNDPKVIEATVRASITVREIANCCPRPLYFQQDPLTDEAWYYYRIDFPHGGPAMKNTFTAAQVATAPEFKKRLLGIAPFASFNGNTTQLDRLHNMQRERLRVVEALGFVGYSREHSAYVFNDLAVKDGRVIPLNEDDYFDLGPVSVKSVDRSVNLEITPWGEDRDLAWVDDLWNAYKAKGLVALAFWFGTFYAEQIRATHKSFPFLEAAGERDTGKSTLIEFLWKLCGRTAYEGFDPSKASLSGRSRTFAQVGNMPVVLMEGDREEDTAKARKFDFDELKSLYNGRSVRTRGAKTGGNETYEPPFRGAIIIEQNRPVDASPAVLSRIVHVWFDGSGYNAETKRAADRLESWSVEDVSGFVVEAARAEKRVLAKVAEVFPGYERGMMENPRVSDRRIAKCHAQLMALLEGLAEVIKIDDDRMAAAQALIHEMAAARKLAIASDHPVVEAFWEAYDYIATKKEADTVEGGSELNHATDDALVAVNLNEFAAVAAHLKTPIPELSALKANLRSSKSRKFVAVRDVKSRHSRKTLHCWVFANPHAAGPEKRRL